MGIKNLNSFIKKHSQNGIKDITISDLQNRMAVEPMPMPTSNVLQAPAGQVARVIGAYAASDEAA